MTELLPEKTVAEPWFSFIRSGKKVYEGIGGVWAELSPASKFFFVSGKVVALHRYQTFVDGITQLGLAKVLPDVQGTAKETVENVYYKFEERSNIVWFFSNLRYCDYIII